MKMWIPALLCLLGAASGFEDKTVTQYLADNPSYYSTLSGLIASAGLSTTLSGTGPFTIFAPTNAAFNKIDQATFKSLRSNTARLANVLKYHVIKQFVLVSMIGPSQQQVTLEGQTVNITSSGGSLLLNGDSRVDNAPNNDIIVNNGVVQPIDTVLFPPQQTSLNIAQILLKEDGRFKDLLLALRMANLVKPLESGDYTLFAPVDGVLAAYKDNLLSPTAPTAPAIYQEVLKYHVVPGGRKASQLRDGQSLFTLQGTSVKVTVGNGVMVNNAYVIHADILATNGVIHAIDKLLVPGNISSIALGW